MVKGNSWVGVDGEGFRVEGDNVYAIAVVFDETAHRDAQVVSAGWGGRDGHGVKRVRRFIGYCILGSQLGFLG